MFNARKITVHNGTFTQYIAREQREFNVLTDMISDAAFYNSGDSPKCHPKTQVAILNQLRNWILGNVDSNASILWFTGEAGSGKSCIARSIAEWCSQRQLLLASFFFLRADSSRNSTERFISTLAYTISQTVPSSRPYIEEAIRSDPKIFSRAIDIQMDSLIINPLHHGSERLDSQSKLTLEESTQPECNVQLPRVVVIDGLDECAKPAQQWDIIRLFLDTIKNDLGWKILITRRTDPAIRKSLDHFVPTGLSTHMTLRNSNEDIRCLLEDKFAELRATHLWRYSIPNDWPSCADIERLASRSFRLFIHAATVIKYLSSSFDNPVDSLDSILRQGARIGDDTNSQDIAAYVHILETSPNLEFWL